MWGAHVNEPSSVKAFRSNKRAQFQMDWLLYRSSISHVVKCQNNHRTYWKITTNTEAKPKQRKSPPVSVWHYIIFSVQIKRLEKSTKPTGTNSTRTGIVRTAKANPHNLKLLLLLPFIQLLCQIHSDTKNLSDNSSFAPLFLYCSYCTFVSLFLVTFVPTFTTQDHWILHQPG